MAKPSARYVCQSCGAVHPKWAGRCDACGEWNTLVEEAVESRPNAPKAGVRRRVERGVGVVTVFKSLSSDPGTTSPLPVIDSSGHPLQDNLELADLPVSSGKLRRPLPGTGRVGVPYRVHDRTL